MAINLWTGAINNNVNNTGNWSLAAVPTSADGNIATFPVSTPNVTFNVAFNPNHLDLSAYTGTITFTNALTVSGSFTDGTGYTLSNATQSLNINGTGTYTPNGHTWANPLIFSNTSTITLGGALTATGTFACSAGAVITLNSSTFTYNGTDFSMSTGTLSGTTNITCSVNGNLLMRSLASAYNGNQVANNLTINVTGIVTFQTFNYKTGTLTLQGGTFTTSGSTTLGLGLQSCTFDSGGFTIEGANPVCFVSGTITLANNNVYLKGSVQLLLAVGGVGSPTINGFNIYFNNGIRNQGNTTASGTTNFVYMGNTATWDSGGSAANTITNNLSIGNGGTLYISGTVEYGGGTLDIRQGRLIPLKSSILKLLTSCTILGASKVFWKTITITSATTITMDSFFQGTTTSPCIVQCATASTYTITFQDKFEKTGEMIKLSGCTLSQKGQLLITNINADKGRNTGVRFKNQLPNSLSKGMLSQSQWPKLIGGGYPNSINSNQ